jgi:amino acid transporter
MIMAIVLAMPNMDQAAAQGGNVFVWTVLQTVNPSFALLLFAGIGIAQYLCGLATVTSASRMTFAFARDGGLPFSSILRMVSPRFKTPAAAIWAVSILCVLFTVYTPVYSTITAVCVIFLYISYVLPTALGFLTYGRQWTQMGPWTIGRWYRPLAMVSVLGCGGLIAVSVLPPNDKALWILGATVLGMAVVWLAVERYRFQGPPVSRFTGLASGFDIIPVTVPTES